VHAETADTWALIQGELRGAVSESTYRIWLSPLRLGGLEKSVLVVEAPRSTQRWVADRFGRLLQTCAAAVLGPEVTVDVVSAESAPAAGRRARRERPPELFGERELSPMFTFEQFVIGSGNRLAHAAALAVAELPALAYNPLFLYGPPGLGKTHLLHAIGHYVRQFSPALGVRCTTGEEFTGSFVNALKTGSMERFKAAYRGVDVLLIDDIQFLQSKARTEEEFFHTFNALYEAGSQLVLTSDRPARDLDELEDRLRERFGAGLITEVASPDFDVRLAILRKRAHDDAIPIEDPAALELIAERVTENVRALEAALIRVVAYQSLTRAPITSELVARVLDSLYGTVPAPRRSVREIQLATCRAFDVSLEELLSSSRSARVARARQIAMYLARELTEASLPALGRQFGGRNHTTVLHAWKRAVDVIGQDIETKRAVVRVRHELSRPGGPGATDSPDRLPPAP
jgi:chromosomal replication initiator protein